MVEFEEVGLSRAIKPSPDNGFMIRFLGGVMATHGRGKRGSGNDGGGGGPHHLVIASLPSCLFNEEVGSLWISFE